MKTYTLFAVFVIPILFVACQSATNTPLIITPTVPISITPLLPPATFTLVPSSTPEPPTATPSPTIEPPAILSNYLKGMVILNVNSFDSMPQNASINHKFVTVQDGVLKIGDQGFQGGFELKTSYGEGRGLMYDFMFASNQASSGFEFETYFENGQRWTDGYHRFGIYLKTYPQADIWTGENGTGNLLNGNLSIKPDAWYRLVLAIGKSGDFLCVVWDPNKPEVNRTFHQAMGKKWAGINWHFVINGTKGNMVVDNLMEISFDGIK